MRLRHLPRLQRCQMRETGVMRLRLHATAANAGDASAAPAGTLTARQHLPRRRRGARGSGAAAPQPGPPAPEEDHAASASDGADIATAAPPANSAGTAVALTRAAGSWLDGLDLSAEFRNPVPTLQTVPRFLITGVRHALVAALGAIRAAHEGRDEAARVRAWKLFLLLPRLLLARSAQIGADGRAALMRRIELFRQGRVDELHAQSAAEHEQAHPRRRGGDNEEARAAAACAKVRRGQLSRARQMLTAAALAPGNAATLEALTDPARRPPHPLRSPAPEVLQYRPSEEVVLTAHQVGEALRTSKRGSAAGLSGATVELYKLLLDDAEALESFTFAVNVTARAQAPQAALDAIALSRLTALRKPNGGVRGIATGDVFRRLVSRALARAFSGELDEATRPFQFALQTRAGTDSLAAMLRAAVELDPRATVVSLDGRSAYDTISRATILAKLRDTVPSLLPFTRAMYARTSTYLWWDDEGRVHDIAQAEGVEQGDPLAPGLYALGQHDSLVAASASLRPDERLAAFLDDLYVVTLPERAAPLLRVVTGEVERGAGVEANLGKTRVFNAEGGDAPPGVDVLGPDVWCGNLPPEQRGFVALGVPIGHPDFVKAQAANRLDAEADLLRQLVQLPDAQCAWLLLAFCAAPRAQHLLRNVPPADILPYARGHDDAVWAVVEGLLGDQGPGEGEDWAAARQVAFLPPSLGGLGLFAAERVSPAAYWAAWADALPVLRQRYPEAAARLVQELEGEPAAPCLRAAAEAARQVTAEGWTSRPEWAACARGADAPAAEGELGLGNPGWQRHAVLALHTSFRERVLLPALAPAARALLHSQSGPHAGMWLAAIPSDAASTLAPDLMHVAMRRRLRLPLPLTALHCGAEGRHGCGAEVDAYGDHHLACPRTGLLPRRGFVVERAWVQVAREAVGPEGRVVPQQWLSRTTAPRVHPGDRRRLDFVVYGATSNGEALCCDATLVSPLTRAGRPVPGADAREGVALVAARRRKVARYPELTRGGPQRLVVLAAEVGGRWSDECQQFLRTLLRLRVQRAPPPLRAAAAQGWARRWWSVLSVALQRAVASSALGVWTMPPLPGAPDALPLGDVLDLAIASAPSRLPLR